MTAFDDQMIVLIAEMATDGEVRASAAELAAALDCSVNTVRRAIQRTFADGRLEVIHSTGGRSVLRLTGVGEQGEDPTHRYPPPLRGGVGTDGYGTHTSRTPPGPPTAPPKSTGPQPRPANRHCPRCEGTGWQAIDATATAVTPCDCRGADTLAYFRTRQRDAAATRQTRPPDGPPAKSDFTEVWRRFTRHQLTGEPAEVPPGVVPI
jgi:hypothetical protein